MTVNAWGQVGNVAFALPMETAEPVNPLGSYILVWNPVTRALAYEEAIIDPGEWTDFFPVVGSISGSGTTFVNTTFRYRVIFGVVEICYSIEVNSAGSGQFLTFKLPVGFPALVTGQLDSYIGIGREKNTRLAHTISAQGTDATIYQYDGTNTIMNNAFHVGNVYYRVS